MCKLVRRDREALMVSMRQNERSKHDNFSKAMRALGSVSGDASPGRSLFNRMTPHRVARESIAKGHLPMKSPLHHDLCWYYMLPARQEAKHSSATDPDGT
jgi:hypothetical protein